MYIHAQLLLHRGDLDGEGGYSEGQILHLSMLAAAPQRRGSVLSKDGQGKPQKLAVPGPEEPDCIWITLWNN